MIWAAGAQMRESLSVRRVYEAQYFGKIVEIADQPLSGGDPSANERENLQGQLAVIGQDRCLRSTEELVATLFDMVQNKLADLVDDGQGVKVAFALRATPGEQSVAAEDDAIAVWSLLDRVSQHHGQLKSGSLPRQPDQLVRKGAVELLHFVAAVGGRRQSDAPVRVQVIDVFVRQKPMQRSINGGRDGVVAEGAERIHL